VRALARVEGWENFVVFVKGLHGDTRTYRVRSTDRLETLKRSIERVEGLASAQQRLIYAGRQLEDGRRLTDYGVAEYSTLHLVLRLCGC